VLGTVQNKWRQKKLSSRASDNQEKIKKLSLATHALAKPNWHILGGSAGFVVITLFLGISDVVLKQEIIFIGSLLILAYLIKNLLQDLTPAKRFEIVSIAIVIFIFRALPTPGAGAGWWQIDVLGFDEAFFGTLRQISALLAIVGMIALRGWMGRKPIPYIIVFLSIYSTAMMLPFLGMYYGLHHWTEAVFGFGAKTIAIIDTMADSPLGQVAMIPMLAWIAREAPENQKATYFAVMAAFTNLALSASHLATQYINKIFIIQRGEYGELGMLFIATALINLCLPIITVLLLNLIKKSKAAML
jgi:hypothetical protein